MDFIKEDLEIFEDYDEEIFGEFDDFDDEISDHFDGNETFRFNLSATSETSHIGGSNVGEKKTIDSDSKKGFPFLTEKKIGDKIMRVEKKSNLDGGEKVELKFCEKIIEDDEDTFEKDWKKLDWTKFHFDFIPDKDEENFMQKEGEKLYALDYEFLFFSTQNNAITGSK